MLFILKPLHTPCSRRESNQGNKSSSQELLDLLAPLIPSRFHGSLSPKLTFWGFHLGVSSSSWAIAARAGWFHGKSHRSIAGWLEFFPTASIPSSARGLQLHGRSCANADDSGNFYLCKCPRNFPIAGNRSMYLGIIWAYFRDDSRYIL